MDTGEAIETVKAFEACRASESVAWTVKLNNPAAVGVPDRVREELSVRPVGSEPAVTPQE